MKIIITLTLLLLTGVSCSVMTFSDSNNTGRDTSCDDGSALSCLAVEPQCAQGLLLAYQDGCYACVDPGTCELPIYNNATLCASDLECNADEWCNPCGAASCPGCTDCVGACQPHGCATEEQAYCNMVQPECGDYGVAIVKEGCYECVAPGSCLPLNTGACDDGSPLICEIEPPLCAEYELRAVIDGCYACVNPDTCEPWGMPSCFTDADCEETQYCDMCASSSCPMCDDCVPGCMDHGCEVPPAYTGLMARPQCDTGTTAISDGYSWHCVAIMTCEERRDSWCDDGTAVTCELLVAPECAEGEVLAEQDNCYMCVNPVTCEPWGEPGCGSDLECDVHSYCSGCATGSCEGCDDCVPGCIAHECETEPFAQCEMERPECGPGVVAVVQDGCWRCVSTVTCETMDSTNLRQP